MYVYLKFVYVLYVCMYMRKNSVFECIEDLQIYECSVLDVCMYSMYAHDFILNVYVCECVYVCTFVCIE